MSGITGCNGLKASSYSIYSVNVNAKQSSWSDWTKNNSLIKMTSQFFSNVAQATGVNEMIVKRIGYSSASAGFMSGALVIAFVAPWPLGIILVPAMAAAGTGCGLVAAGMPGGKEDLSESETKI
ncbi:MAG: hypothetical protein ACM3JI_02575 [Anaerolineae bacterium]